MSMQTYILPPASERFATIMGDLRQGVVARGPVIGAIVWLIWTRLSRTAYRFAKLAARIQSGTLPTRSRASRAGRTSTTRASDRPAERPVERPVERLPRGRGWLFRLVPVAPCFGSQLNYLLSDPEMQALLAATPQMGRLLRPLCHSLGIRISDHPLLQPPPRVRPAASRESQSGGGSRSPAASLRAAGEAIHDQRARTSCGSPRRFAPRDDDGGSIRSHRNRSHDSAAADDGASGDAVAPKRKSARRRRAAEPVFYAGLQAPVRLPDVDRSGEPPPWAEPIRPIKR